MRFKGVAQKLGLAVAALLLWMSLLLVSGCFSTPRIDDSRPRPTTQVLVSEESSLFPVLCALFDDKSSSMKSARVNPLREEDLIALIKTLRTTGGELAFGLIGDSTDRPLLRLRIPTPPPRPQKPEIQNAFERAEEDALFQQQLEQYEADMKNWSADIDQRTSSFIDAVRPRLREQAIAKTSPINSALIRSELFLNEPATAWNKAPRRYIILNSDAIDTTKTAPATIKSGATVMLVNGNGSLGTLQSLEPIRFESIKAAFDHIAATEIGRNK